MHTVDALTTDLRTLLGSLPPTGTLLVHSGLRALGPVAGGPDTVVAALRAAAGPGVTIAAPTFTTNLIDPATWPVPAIGVERERILREMPVVDPATSPPHHMGAIATALWRTPGAIRSRHPVTSWAALGPGADALCADIPLDDPEGPDGVPGRVWRSGGHVLLLGVDHDANTTIHLAESLLDMPHLRTLPDRYPVDGPEGRTWRPVAKTTKCSDGFVAFGPHVAAAAKVGRVGDATATLLPSAAIVARAGALLAHDPTALLCADPTCTHCPTSRRALAGFRGDPARLRP